MKIIDWITVHRTGKIFEHEDRFEIVHNSGENSTLFKNKAEKANDSLVGLGDVYTKFDGIDLFSSTFKIASISNPKSIDNVELIESLETFKYYVSSLAPVFPEDVIPFMYQAGIGIYAVGTSSGMIYEWDTEQEELTGRYHGLEEIFQEWLDAIS